MDNMENYVAEQEALRAWMEENSLYRQESEHASCGVGLVVNINGKPSRKVVEAGITALKAVWHRGAVDADGKTGDGAGIHLEIPAPFFYDQIRRTGHEPRMDELIDAIEVELDRPARAKMWHELQRIYAEDLPAIPLYFRSDAHIWPRWITNITPTGHLAPVTLQVEDWRVEE